MTTYRQVAPELFPTRQQHLDFRGYTHLLQLFDQTGYDREHGKGLFIRPTGTGNQDWATYDYVTTAYTNTMVRHSRDIVAIKVYGGVITVIKNGFVAGEKLMVTCNPRSDYFEATKDEFITPAGNMRVSAAVLHPGVSELEQSENIINFVLEQTIHAREKRLNEIQFVDHVSYHLSLLRSCHAASTDEEFKRAKERFSDYVLFSSVDKIATRLRIGHNKRNFRLILTKKPGEISDEQYRVVISEKLRGLSPNSKQSRFRYDFFKALKYTDEHAEAMSKKPVYDQDSRQQFHMMLAYAVRALYSSQEKLSRKVDFRKPTVDRQVIHARRSDIAKLYSKFRSKLNLLHRFLDAFDVGEDDCNPLLAHLAWLYNVSGAASQLDTRDLFKTAVEIEQSGPATAGALPVSGEEKKADSDDDDDDDGEEEEVAQLEAFPKGWSLAARKFLRIVNLHSDSIARATNIHSDDSKNSTKQRHESTLVKSSTVAALDVRFGELDNNRTSLADCIDQLIVSHAATKKNNQSHLKKEDILDNLYHSHSPPVKGFMTEEQRRSLKVKFNDDSRYGGSMHCETMLMAAAVCARRSDIARDVTETNVECPGLFTAETAIFELKDARQFISVSKRCCPACWKVVEEILKVVPEVFGLKVNEGKPKELLVPGYHTKWTAVSLPPFLPLTIAGAVLEHAKSAALKALIAIQANVSNERDKRAISSGHTPENTPSPEKKTPERVDEMSDFDDDDIEFCVGMEEFVSSPPVAAGGSVVHVPVRKKETHRVTDETGEEPETKK